MSINDRYLDLVLFGIGVREIDVKDAGGRKACLRPIWLWSTGTSAAFPSQSVGSHTRAFALVGSPVMWLMI